MNPVEESEWVSPMVVQEKKTKGEIRICVNLRKINDASLHDPFSTPFTNEEMHGRSRKKLEREHDNEGTKYKRDL